jgi:iron uptake system EfeUOB component EfeO/EfeM
MAKLEQKAQKLVDGAVSVFADAIVQVEKANEILKESIDADVKKLEDIVAKHKKLEVEKDAIMLDKDTKYKQMEANSELIEKLSHFSK